MATNTIPTYNNNIFFFEIGLTHVSFSAVFGDSIGKTPRDFSAASIQKVLSMFNGFLITTTYRGIIVVVSQNVNQYLGYNEVSRFQMLFSVRI